MAAKRYLESQEEDQQQPAEKRNRKNHTLASAVEQVLMLKNRNAIAAAIEPMLRRRVLCEAMEEGLRGRSIKLMKAPSFRVQQQSSLRLAFSKALALPIFTDTKILTGDGTPLRVLLLDSAIPAALPPRIKIEILVLDGEFSLGDTWTTEEFNRKIVKERSGKRPLLAGELSLSMKDGVAAVGDLHFTDNSSWTRGRKFRIGVRVAPGFNCGGLKISEGFSDAFVVRDHRGELYKKHHPPILEDEVWRLEKIGKGGAFDKLLASEGIKTVQDFLRAFVTDPMELRKILGNMSDKMWKKTTDHAKECLPSNKRYIYHATNCSITFNPICQVVTAEFDGKLYHSSDLQGCHKTYVEQLPKIACKNWDSLKVVEGDVVNSGALITQGHHHLAADSETPPMPNNQLATAIASRFPEEQLPGDSSYGGDQMRNFPAISNNETSSPLSSWIVNYEPEFLDENLAKNPDSSWTGVEMTYPEYYITTSKK